MSLILLNSSSVRFDDLKYDETHGKHLGIITMELGKLTLPLD